MEAGLFNYTPWQKIGDMMRSDPLGVGKDVGAIVVGGVTAKSGLGLCTTGSGCAAGIPMTALGAGDITEGVDSLYNRYNGINSPGVNPLRYGFDMLSPTWGDSMYDVLNLGASVLALRAQVPLKMGVSDGLNRPGTMFDVMVPRMSNNTLIPFINAVAPYGTTQVISIFEIVSKGTTVVKDVNQAGVKK
jgi:filamentous hemagglutinin